MTSNSDETDSMHRSSGRFGDRSSSETEPRNIDGHSVNFGERAHSGLDIDLHTKTSEFHAGLNARLRDIEERLQHLDRPIIVQHPQQVSSRIADSIIAPEKFTGDASKQDPEQYLSQFNKFAQYKGMPDNEKCQLLQLLCIAIAQDWIGNLPQSQLSNWTSLEREFRAAFCKSDHLKYADVQKLFQTAQELDEKVDPYFIRMRKAARCLDLSDEMVQYAIIGGLSKYKTILHSKFPVKFERSLALCAYRRGFSSC
jgi:hypothetical protein